MAPAALAAGRGSIKHWHSLSFFRGYDSESATGW